jgi:Zn-dependent protease with chaperone function
VDFFQAQDEARRLSSRLVFLFGAAVISMIALVSMAVLVILGIGVGPDAAHPGFVVLVAAGMLLLIGGGSAVRTAQLRKGGSAVAELLGGRRVDPSTTEPLERRLMNVVEEMALASGVPVPAVYVMDQEPGINAFAAGHTLHDAAVAITRGGLEAFTREELEGVVAHEFSHILNGDMRLNIRLMGVLYGILILTVIGRSLLRAGTRSGHMTRARSGGKNSSGGQAVALGLVLVIFGYLGVFFGRLIQASVSRQREFLADAAAVQFTRNPAGIGGALRRIAALPQGSVIQDAHAQEASHLFFAGGVRSGFVRAMATHPPIEVRIARVDPGGGTRNAASAGGAVPGPAAAGLQSAGLQSAGLQSAGLQSAGALGFAGQLPPEALGEARRFLSDLPGPLRHAAGSVHEVRPLVLALALSVAENDSAVPSGSGLPADLVQQAIAWVEPVRALGVRGRLPLLELALPTLSQLTAADARALLDTVSRVALSDGRIDPFDFALVHLLGKSLPGGELPARRSGWAVPLHRLLGEVELLLSLVAQWEGDGPRAGALFEGGVQAMLSGSGAMMGAASRLTTLSLRPTDSLTLERVTGALDRLGHASPDARSAIMAGLAAMLEASRSHAEPERREALRVLGEALEVPVPVVHPG